MRLIMARLPPVPPLDYSKLTKLGINFTYSLLLLLESAMRVQSQQTSPSSRECTRISNTF